MKKLVSFCIASALSGAAVAGLPTVNATCPGNIEVHADEGGPVYLNGKQAKLKKINDNSFEATGAGIVVSIDVNPDGSPSVMYTGKNRANGICPLADFSAGSKAAAPAPAPSGGGDKVAVKNMAQYCAGEASEKFHVRPTNISTQPAVKDQGMYSVFGQFPPSGADPTVFICTFSADGKFVGVDKQ